MKGIYLIAIGEYRYVGQSQNVQKRRAMHFNLLKHNKHNNSILQKIYNRYGLENSSFKLLEEIDFDEYLYYAEEAYIEIFKNLYKDKCINILSGELNDSPTSKFFAIVSPEGEYFEGYNLSKFCRDRNIKTLERSKMTNDGHHLGWRLATQNEIQVKISIDPPYEKRKKNYNTKRRVLNTLTKEIYVVNNLTQLAKDLDEPPQIFAAALSNKRKKKYKHYRLLD